MYDYVIVGAGSAGCVLANRLSEDPDVSVLLLEAGRPDVKENIHVPLGYLQLQRTDVDWDYVSAPEPRCNGRRIAAPPRQGRSAAPLRSTRWSTSAATTPTTTTGASTAGAGTTSCPTSSRPRTTSAAPRSGTATGGPLPVSDPRSGSRISPGLGRGRGRGRARPQRRLQRRRAGRRRPLPGDPARGHARERRGRLPAPGDGAGEPDRDAVHAGRAGAVRGHPRGRRRGLPARRGRRSCAPSAR